MSIYNNHISLNTANIAMILGNVTESTRLDEAPILKLSAGTINYLANFFLSFPDTLAMRKTCRHWKQQIDMDLFIKKCYEQNHLSGLYHFIFKSRGYPFDKFADTFFQYASTKQQGKLLFYQLTKLIGCFRWLPQL